ncbi:response regulator [Desulfuromonas sp. TF]|uniref:response regulator n=1 Tax=Desulfuromonas sp. TF TaxID=1232410 RepID=UPI00041CB740|nr:response regulator [Desulfuromonas sp. TF]
MDRPAILIVDDREENLIALERILERTDAVIVKAHSGNEALKACLNHDFALALLDVNMPEMSGYELAELMRGEKCLSTIPIIFLTAANTQQHQIFNGYSCGAVDYLIKPLQPEILLNKVTIFLDIYLQKRELHLRGRALEQLNRELQRATEKAEAATKAKSEFLAHMSHEIRTPMTVFLAVIEHLRQIDENPERRHLLDMADQSARRLRFLIDDILDFSRIEARRVDLKEETFDLRSCMREAVEMFDLSAREKDLRLETEVSPDTPPVVLGDPSRLGQVLINLVGNAVKFTHEGGVRISVQPREDLLEFSVIDSGIGIPEEKRHLLFQSFSQIDSTFQRQYGGTGLGLAISKGLVELMGGRIEVQGRKEGGSIFTFTLPLKAAESGKLSSPETLSKKSGGESPSAHILLAEDEPIIRELITLLLARRGWQADTAESGREAIEKWEGGEFDIVLMDLQMPAMNGLEASREIRKREAEGDRRTCIIGLTAHSWGEIMDDCLKAGMDEVLTKPVQMDDLYSAIDRCLSK